MAATITPILQREGGRTARRWQTYALRTLYSGLLIAVLMIGMAAATYFANSGNYDPTDSAYLGRVLFGVFSVIQMLVAGIMAPLLTSRAIIDERIEGTLELLILTPIRASDVLFATVGSRIAMMLFIVLGTLPLQALITTLGGVSVREVVMSTIGNLVILLVLSTLGGFFGLFTKSPILALLASFAWCVPFFFFLPWLGAAITGSATTAAVFSPLFAQVADWWGVGMLITYLPMVWMTWWVGSRLFALKIANSSIRRIFSRQTWGSRPMTYLGIGVAIGLITLVPLGTCLSYNATAGNSIHPGISSWTNGALGRMILWVWLEALLILASWLFLRISMDLVDAIDSSLSSFGKGRARRKQSRGHRIGRNPVRWRELRTSSWGTMTLPLLIVWVLGLLLSAYSFIWLIPGGLVGLAVINGLLTLVLTVWLATGSVEQERRGKTFHLLAMTTMSSGKIFRGKWAGVLIPSLPFALLTPLLFFPGQVYLGNVVQDADVGSWIGWAAGVSVWMLIFWLFASLFAMWVAFRVKSPSSAYGVGAGLIAAIILVPTFFGWAFRSFWPIHTLMAVLMPAAVPNAGVGTVIASICLFFTAAALLMILLIRNVRHWGLNT